MVPLCKICFWVLKISNSQFVSKEEVANVDENQLRTCEQGEIAPTNIINISFESK